MSDTKISLLFHSHFPYERLRALVGYALKLGFKSIWINDSKGGDPVKLLNALRSEFGPDVALGLAALNTYRWLADDPRLIISRIPAETVVSIGVGDLREVPSNVKLASLVDKTVEFAETSKAMGFKTLLAAQGPRMLKLSTRFDGAMFGFIKPRAVRYARDTVGRHELYATSPSLVHSGHYTDHEHAELLSSAKYLYDGASDAVKRMFSDIHDYYVSGTIDDVANTMLDLQGLGVSEVVLAYPQTMSESLILQARTLARQVLRRSL